MIQYVFKMINNIGIPLRAVLLISMNISIKIYENKEVV